MWWDEQDKYQQYDASETIQRNKYIVQVVVWKLAAMSEKNNVSIIWNEGSR